jgi:hypothetical protein
MTLGVLLVIAGAVLGIAGYRAWFDAMRDLAHREREFLVTELRAEITRLREQVSRIIGANGS